MNERNLSRKLSSSVVDALKAHGHILVVKGGAAALARELDELMAPEVAIIEPRIKPYVPVVGEPTSTFGDENVDQAVEDMVQKLTKALMSSDHVEDVFAEDAVIRRDIFRMVRDGLREAVVDAGEGGGGEDASITVKLDTLGYVAATASRRTDPATLRQALDRAASVAGARFSGFSPELREATFRLEGNGVDERLEIEEAVADELTDLVEQGVVELPTIERRIDLGRPLPASELRALRGRIDAAAEATLLRSGCAASWEMADPRTVRILFTPLSDQDARGVDAPTGAFAREIAGLLVSRTEAKAAAQLPPPTSPRSSGKAAPRPPPSEPEPAPESEPAPEKKPAPAKRKAKEAAEPAPAAAKKTAAKTATKTTAKKTTAKKKTAASAAAEAPATKTGAKRAPAAKTAKATGKKR